MKNKIAIIVILLVLVLGGVGAYYKFSKNTTVNKDNKAGDTAQAQNQKPKIDLDGYDAEIFEALRSLRMEIAQANHIPPYVVFSDKTLKEMSIARPTDRAGMLAVSGVGEVKFERYGEEFLARLQNIIKE